MSKYFKKFGVISSLNVVNDEVNMKNCGFVVYENLNSYENCLQENNHYLNGRKINVKKANMPSICKIKAQLPSGVKISKDKITTYFGKLGKTVDIDFFIPKSEVLIRYKDRESVIKAVNEKHHTLGDVTITVEEISKKKKRQGLKRKTTDNLMRYQNKKMKHEIHSDRDKNFKRDHLRKKNSQVSKYKRRAYKF